MLRSCSYPASTGGSETRDCEDTTVNMYIHTYTHLHEDVETRDSGMRRREISKAETNIRNRNWWNKTSDNGVPGGVVSRIFKFSSSSDLFTL